MTGPPTPPPTSQTEIADEARAAVPVAVDPSLALPPATVAPIQQKQGPQDSYQLLFPTLANLAFQDEYKQIVAVAEREDLKGESDRQLTRLLIITPLTLAYLILDDLPPARYALTRLPDKTASHPLAQALFGLLSAVWESNYENVYSRAESLYQYAQQSDFPDPKLGEVTASMVKIFVASFQGRAVKLLSRAFTSLPLPLAQKYIGLSVEQLLSVAEKHGWLYDASKQILSPTPFPQASAVTVNTQGPSSLINFNLVANSTAVLEM